MTYMDITNMAKAAVTELIEIAQLQKGDLFGVGCSSCEVAGGVIGHDSSIDAARAVYDGIKPILDANGI